MATDQNSDRYTSSYNFAEEKQRVLGIADALRQSATPLEFRARLLACVNEPWHTYDLLDLTNIVTCVGEGLGDLIGEDLDFDGMPQ